MGSGASDQNTRMMWATRPRNKFDDVFSRRDRTHEHDEQRTTAKTARRAVIKITWSHLFKIFKTIQGQDKKKMKVNYEVYTFVTRYLTHLPKTFKWTILSRTAQYRSIVPVWYYGTLQLNGQERLIHCMHVQFEYCAFMNIRHDLMML